MRTIEQNLFLRRLRFFLTVFAVLLFILTVLLLLVSARIPANRLRKAIGERTEEAGGVHKAYHTELREAAERLSVETQDGSRSYLSGPLLRRLAEFACSDASVRAVVRGTGSGTVLFSSEDPVPEETRTEPDTETLNHTVVKTTASGKDTYDLRLDSSAGTGNAGLSLTTLYDVTSVYESAERQADTVSRLILIPVAVALLASVCYVIRSMRRKGGSPAVRKMSRSVPWRLSVAVVILCVAAGLFVPRLLLRHADAGTAAISQTELDSLTTSKAVKARLLPTEEAVAQILSASYTREDFGIGDYVSSSDEDGDGIDDQTDIYESALAYVAGKPAYVSEYYDQVGYAPGDRGVCTDVIAFGFLGAGYDLMEMINEDIRNHPEDYPNADDQYIDFRRVENQLVFFSKYAAESLTTDYNDISQWQPGDIVVFEKHIGFVAAERNYKGIPLLLHHGREDQTEYIEDRMEYTDQAIVGHFRWR